MSKALAMAAGLLLGCSTDPPIGACPMTRQEAAELLRAAAKEVEQGELVMFQDGFIVREPISIAVFAGPTRYEITILKNREAIK